MVSDLPLARLQLHLRAQRALRLTEFPGFVWRGALGVELRRMVCVTGMEQCRSCPMHSACAYPRLFEPEPPLNQAPRGLVASGQDAPPPFIVAPQHGRRVEAEQELVLCLVVVGSAIAYAPYLILALQRAAARGIGPDRAELTLTAVQQEQPVGSGCWQQVFDDAGNLAVQPGAPPVIAPPPTAAEIRIDTPLRLRIGGRYAGVERIAFGPFFTTLLRRISLLALCHAPEVGQPRDPAQLAAIAQNARCRTDDLRWHDWHRRSQRQGKPVPMGGVTGRFIVSGSEITELWPWLAAGQWLHAGKGAAMGLGHYTLTSVPGSGEREAS